jgi:4-diphosphocytidyl-2-C-methyl-D-erythritol kinase
MTAVSEDTGAAPASVTVRVPGKVNLGLSVGRVRDDGFHPVATAYHAVSVYDTVIATPGDGTATVEVRDGRGLRSAAFDDVPLDATNLAVRAAHLLAAEAGVDPDVALEIHKDIPVAGGMAGGSADAAAALVACDRLWRLGTPREVLHDLAARLGSDVPFLLQGGTVLGHGRGEQLTPVLARGRFTWVLATSDRGLSAGAVYAECDRLRSERGFDAVPEPRVPDALLSALRAGDAEELGEALSNDLETAALTLRPSLRQVLEIGRDLGVLGAVVSGSGPTCAFLVRDDAHSLDLTVSLSASGLCTDVLRAHGPVHGARVVDDEIG